jgi:DNA-binding response OmpR family regulator
MNAARPDVTPEEPRSQARLLIIDDDPVTCRLLGLQMEMEGYSCTTLVDPDQVLAVIEEESPSLVLVDYHLGTQDVLDLLHSIRDQEACRNLPIVVMSALDHRRESVSAGASGFVLEPFSVQDLMTTIREVLEATEA